MATGPNTVDDFSSYSDYIFNDRGRLRREPDTNSDLTYGESTMKRFTMAALLALLVAGTGMLSACNTVNGAGKDIEKAGEGVQKASE